MIWKTWGLYRTQKSVKIDQTIFNGDQTVNSDIRLLINDIKSQMNVALEISLLLKLVL
jgi:hypothetical protein